MTALDQIAQMQAQGMGEGQIVEQLRARGVSEQEIANAMSQSQIKQAVVGGTGADQSILGQGPPTSMDLSNQMPANQFPGGSQAPSQTQSDLYASFGGAPSPGQEPYGSYAAQGGDPHAAAGQEGSGEYAGMQPSMLTQGAGSGEYASVGGEPTAAGTVQDSYGGEAYPMYQPYQEAMSSDVITEISEQIVNEKLSGLHDKIEKILDMRTVVEANMTNLNDRLKRMEKIVDQMQVSVLKKVGEYMTDIQDVKNELEETQKSFVAIQKNKPEKKHKK